VIVTTLLGYFILLVFFYAERRLRRGGAARSFEAGASDRHPTRYLGLAYGVSILALLAAWVFNVLRAGMLPLWVAWAGVFLALCGLFMRTWANRVQGRFYTRTLRVAEGQKIIQDGPYGVIRHPGYLGMILMWLGVSMATGNWIVLAIVAILIAAAYYYRIETEEKLLLKSLPGYAEYRARTSRLIPFIY
jgi:protein-S-isoprenylcysteine O-methyltransferase Ste14